MLEKRGKSVHIPTWMSEFLVIVDQQLQKLNNLTTTCMQISAVGGVHSLMYWLKNP